MIAEAVVSTAAGGRYRVSIGGTISAEIPALHSAYRLEIDFEAKTHAEKPPEIGDRVLCFFPGAAYTNGCILGILEG